MSQPSSTFAAALQPHTRDWASVRELCGPAVDLISELLGTPPNSFPYLAIWPTGLRTLTLLVPSMLNLPTSLVLQPRMKRLLGMALYHSSKASSSYCSAHGVVYALRRGAAEVDLRYPSRPEEIEVQRVSEALGVLPCPFTLHMRQQLEDALRPEEAAWVVSAASMMGYLNMVIGTLGVPLEHTTLAAAKGILKNNGYATQSHVADGPTEETATEAIIQRDSLPTYLRIARFAPLARRQEMRWTQGVPHTRAEVQSYLLRKTGYAFPLLQYVSSDRMRRNLATCLRDNLNPETSLTGLRVKYLAAVIFGSTVYTPHLQWMGEALLTAHGGISAKTADYLEGLTMAERPKQEAYLEILAQLASLPDISIPEAYLLLLTRLVADPGGVDAAAVELIQEEIKPEMLIEMLSWLGMLQLMHRYCLYFGG